MKPKHPHGDPMTLGNMRKLGAVFAAIATAAGLGSARAAEVERWLCEDEYGKRKTWTIVDDKMFVPGGKVRPLKVISNSPSLTLAYWITKTNDGLVFSLFYVLDKTGRKLFIYDDATAVMFKGKFGQPFEPKIREGTCEEQSN